MNSKATLTVKNFFRWNLASAFSFVAAAAWAQPALISSVPVNGAKDVPVNTSVVFTFNTTMDTGVSSATFYYHYNEIVPVTSSWSAGNTVLTCTAIGGFPPETNIMWSVTGLSTHNELITPSPTGEFTTPAAPVSLSLVNPTFDGSAFRFDVLTSSNQSVVVEYKTNLAASAWQQLLTTNSPGDQFSVSAPGGANLSMFFRARTGP